MMNNDIAINKNTGFKKMIQLLLSPNINKLRVFLKKHSIELDEYYYNQIEYRCEQLKNKMIETYEDKQQKEDTQQNSYIIIYTYVTASIEKVWSKYKANIANKPMSYTCRIIKRNRNLVKKDLEESLQNNFIEIDEFINKLVSDLEFEKIMKQQEEEPKAVLNNVT